jgi:membrane associated rhomboid family serine protease
MLGTLALRNPHFMERAETYNFGGDQVALDAWKKKFTELKELQQRHPSYRWGVSRLKNNGVQWISYQFAHGGWSHLFWNTLFLILFGCFIEVTLGSSFVAIAYVGGGLTGAAFFSWLSGISSSPLVGASAAVSALLSLVAFSHLRKREIRFFYWLMPIKGYYGFILLPGWVLLIVSLLPDVSGYLAASQEFGSVAYSAHMGGAVFGALMACFLRFGILKLETTEEEEDFEDRDEDRRAS